MTTRSRKPRLAAERLEAREVPATAFALGINANANNLFRFDTATPGTIDATTPITGLTAGDVIVGTDFRPATGGFYGVGVNNGANTVQLYTINPNTGIATPVGAAAVTFAGTNTIAGATAWGVDFNPVADRVRVVNNLASDANNAQNVNNFRLNPNDGSLVNGAPDADLDFAAAAGAAPIVGVAYTNADTDTATGTALFGIAAGNQSLVSLTSAGAPAGQFQTVNPVGPLGVAADVLSDLDIYGPTNQTAAILDVGGQTKFGTVNLTSGAATAGGNIGTGILALGDISVAPAAAPVVAGGSLDGKVVPLAPTAFGAAADLGKLTAGTAVTLFAGSTANVRTATADVNGDGIPDLIGVTGPGTPIRVTVVSGADNTTVLVAAFDPFGGNFTGGGFVTAVDLDAGGNTPDGRAEFVVTPDQGGGPRVSVFTLKPGDTTATVRANFFGIDDPNFRGGARATTADVDGDGRQDVVVAAGFGGGPRVAIFNGTTVFATPTRLIDDFFAFPGTDATNLRNGVFLTAGDVNGDGREDLIFGGGPGGGPRVFILDGTKIAANQVPQAQTSPIANFFVKGNAADRGGVRLAANDLDGDGRADLIVGSGEGVAATTRVYLGKNFTTTAEPTTFQDVAVFGGAVLANGVFVG